MLQQVPAENVGYSRKAMAVQKTKYQTVLDYIRDAIVSGKYSAGDRLPSDGQLVRQFSASRPTIARAMRDLEKEGFLERRAGSGSFVRVPAQRKSSLIGLLVPELGRHELFEPICNEIAFQCQKYNLSLLWSDWSGNTQDEDLLEAQAFESCRKYIEMKVAGVFFAPIEFSERLTKVNIEIANRLDAAGISVVLLDRDMERMPRRSRFDMVGIDNFRVGILQTQHLIDLGAKKVAHVSREGSAQTIDYRIAGYQEGLRMNGHKYKDRLVFAGDPDDESFYKLIAKHQPDGIVCSNDTAAAKILRLLIKNNVKVPEEVRIIGVDDIKIASLTSIPLSTIRQPCRDMGTSAVLLMVRRIENRNMPPRSVMLDVELTVRDSCGGNLVGAEST